MRLTSKRIRVMLIDGAEVRRRVLQVVLRELPGVNPVGVSGALRAGLLQSPLLRPDVILLAIDAAPEMSLQALRELRQRGDKTQVVVFGRSVTTAIRALSEGANARLALPHIEQGKTDYAAVREAVEHVIYSVMSRARPSLAPKLERRPKPALAGGPPEAVIILSSTGGPHALAKLIPRLPEDLPVPVIVVQHMGAEYTKLLARRLDTASKIGVQEAVDKARVQGSKVYIAPGGRHLAIGGSATRSTFDVFDGPFENQCRPSADVLLRSVARVWGGRVVVCVLSGMEEDGVIGVAKLSRLGAHVLSQASSGCGVWGASKRVAEAGYSSVEVQLERMASAIIEAVTGSSLRKGA